jgi:hypothetical protein
MGFMSNCHMKTIALFVVWVMLAGVMIVTTFGLAHFLSDATTSPGYAQR